MQAIELIREDFLTAKFSEVSVICSVFKRSDDIALRALERNHFEGASWYFRDINFVRDSASQITGFEVSTDKKRVRIFTLKKWKVDLILNKEYIGWGYGLSGLFYLSQ